jgi:hypothetical protein
MKLRWLCAAMTVLAVCGAHWVIVGGNHGPAWLWDTPSYVMAATNPMPMGAGGKPFYPWLLRLCCLNLQLVVWLQFGLMLASTVEVFVLARRLGACFEVATLAAGEVGSNLYILQYERLIYTESLAMWLVVTLFLTLERLLRTRSRDSWVAVCALSMMLFLTRPNFVVLPFMLFGALAWRTREWRRAALCVLAYGSLLALVLLYNWINWHFVGLSSLARINLLGKILEFDMQAYATDPSLADMQAAAVAKVASGTREEWRVWETAAFGGGKDYQFDLIAQFAGSICKRYPLQFFWAGLCDFKKVWLEPQWWYCQPTIAGGMLHFFQTISERLLFWVNVSLPLLGAAALAWWAGEPADDRRWLCVLLAASIVFQIALTGFAVASEFTRIQMPLDWGLFLLAFMLAEAAIGRVRARHQSDE